MIGFLRRNPNRALIAQLYQRIVDASRQQALYSQFGVPDTLEGRFESLTVHMVLVLRTLRRWPDPAADVARDLTDAFFAQLDASLRELGVGDVAVPKRMKRLAEAFYGRAQAYDAALDAHDEAGLAGALGRNVLGRAEPAAGLARYVLAAEKGLGALDLDRLLGEGPNFPPPQSLQEGAP